MGLTPKTIECYEWNDIQQFLCDQLGIDKKWFRDYARRYDTDGFHADREYQDFWHVWLWIIDDRLMNDSIMPYYPIYGDDDLDYFKEQITKMFGEWVLDIIDPLIALADEIGEQDTEIWIHYSW